MKDKNKIKRFFEILPGSLSWGIILFFILLAVINPVICAVTHNHF